MQKRNTGRAIRQLAQIFDYVTLCLTCIASAGAAYQIFTLMAARRIMSQVAQPQASSAPSVTVLKPLHGAEPKLLENLSSFVDQTYGGPVAIVFGVADSDDPACAVVEALQRRYPDHDLRLVVDRTTHGSNAKVSNLINMDRGQSNEIVVLADSDIVLPPGALQHIVAALGQPGVGAVSCLYRGADISGLWSRLSALGIDAHFLPNAALGIAFGLATPCFGSTIALRRSMLRQIGGFETLRNHLADDYALGAAVRKQGLRVVFPAMIVDHLCGETHFAALWRHDLRWARTIRAVNPAGYVGSLVTNPVPLALLATVSAGFALWSLLVSGAIIGIRLIAFHRLQSIFNLGRGNLALIPLRDILSLAVFVWSFGGRSVDWRGQKLAVAAGGDLVVRRPPPSGQ